MIGLILSCSFKRLQHRMIVAFSILLVISILANSSLALWQITHQTREDYQKSIDQKMQLLDHHVHYYANTIASNTKMLAELPLIMEADHRITTYKDLRSPEGLIPMQPMLGDPYEQAVYGVLKTFQQSHDSVKNASLGVESNGGFVMHPPRPRFNEYDARERQWYQKAMERPGEVILSEIYTTSSGEKVVLCVMAVLDELGQLRGVITIDFDLKELSLILGQTTIGQSGYVLLTDSQGSIVAYPDNPEQVGKSLADIGLGALLKSNAMHPQQQEGFPYKNNTYHVQVTPSTLADFPLYYVSFIQGSEFYQSAWDLSRNLATIALFLLILTLFLAYWLSRQLTGPLTTLSQFADQLAAGDLSQRLQLPEEDEIGQLAQRFNAMASAIEKSQQELTSKVEERTYDLSASNKALQHTNEELHQALVLLKNTQQQLIQSEKLAGLGTLVAGLAHEINTPLGGSISIASYLEHQIQQLLKAIQAQQVDRQQFDAYMQRMQESIEVLLRNLGRSSDLIQHFKQVAVDHTQEEKREFYVKAYVEETLLGFQHLLRDGKHTVTLECDDALSIHSFPGSLAQIISILTQNALEHGFYEQEEGAIHISFQQQGHRLILTYKDNGAGMEKDVKARIFDPFFTTSRHRGHVGLGLHILYNILSLQLKGDVTVESEPGKGTRFYLIWESS